jgi:hypothetical protein
MAMRSRVTADPQDHPERAPRCAHQPATLASRPGLLPRASAADADRLGKYDKIFPADGAYSCKRNLPDVEFHLLDTCRFALEDRAGEMVPLIRKFLGRKVK